ncbi:MAG: hypothetical protein GC202_05680 [Alphaproteobacteria bacterium]|nr:hypothetical protein [Alphaproteobacteria bacterium]
MPTPEDVDAHHADIESGGPGLIALAPRIAAAPMPGLPDIGEAGRASNAAQIDWLAGNRSGFDGVPEQLARYVREQGDAGLAQAQDFLGQFGQRRPSEVDALLAGVLGRLPEADLRARLLGVAPGSLPPVGVRRTLELRRDETDPGPDAISDLVDRPGKEPPNMRLLASGSTGTAQTDSGAGGEPQGAPAPSAPDKFEKPPAYRADVFAAQPGVWETVRDKIKADPGLNDSQRAAILGILAGEGGLRPDPRSGAVGGITKDYLDAARSRPDWPAELDHVKSPDDLKPADMPAMYRHYLDGALRHAGGFDALGKIANPTMAAAIADTIVREGEQGAREMIHAAIKDSGGPAELPVSTRQRPDGRPEPTVIGPKTFDALIKFGSEAMGSSRFLSELTKQRTNEHPRDEKRNRQFLAP